MKEKTSRLLQKAAKYLIFACVLASFVFIGCRIATKGEYTENELARCQALAISAVQAACDALDSRPLASYVDENGETEFIIDHKKMPGHNVVSVKIAPLGGSYRVLAVARTGWNSRSPQQAEAEAVKKGPEVRFKEENAMLKAFRVLAAREKEKEQKLTFTFPDERECPVPFDVTAVTAYGLYKAPLVVLRAAR